MEELDPIIVYSVDISDAEPPEPLPVSTYPASIRSAVRKTSARGTEYAEVGFYIEPDNFPADYPLENAPDGKTLYYRRLSLEDNAQARFRVRKFCEAIGAPRGKRIDLNDWIGRDANVAISHDTYEGVTKEQIDKVIQAD